MSDILKAIEEFVHSPRDKSVAARVSKYASVARSKGWATDSEVLTLGKRDAQTSTEENLLLSFFSPVGYRPLFEREIIFLMSDGLGYRDILEMPVHLRKALIDQKLGKVRRSTDEEPEIPPALLEQFRLAAKSRQEKEGPKPRNIHPVPQGGR